MKKHPVKNIAPPIPPISGRKGKKGENYDRVNNILSADKLSMSPECRAVALNDIKKVLTEYFDVEDLTMEIREAGRGFSVEIRFHTVRVKSFNLLK